MDNKVEEIKLVNGKYTLTDTDIVESSFIRYVLDVANIGHRELEDLNMPLYDYYAGTVHAQDYPNEHKLFFDTLSTFESYNTISEDDEVINIVDSKEKLTEWRKNVLPHYLTVG